MSDTSQRRMRLARRNACACLTAVSFALVGCANTMQFRMTSVAPDETGATAWWVLTDPAGIREPIVVIERRTSPTTSEQVALTDRGVRIFRHSAGASITASVPIVGPGSVRDPVIVRAAMRRYATGSAPAPVIPPKTIAAIGSAAEAWQVLREHWTELQINPPRDLTHRDLDAQLQLSRHSVSELLEIQKAM